MERDKAIDIARGISILLVLMGHSAFIPSSILVFIHSFHVPLFFFISGMVFSYSKYPQFKDFLKSKAKSLLIPYFLLGIIVISIDKAYRVFKNGQAITNFFSAGYFKNIQGLFVGYRLNGPYYSFWFILVLFVSMLAFYFIAKNVDKYKKKNAIYISIAVILSALGCVLIKFVKGFVWSLDIVPIALSFVTFGYLVKINKEKISNKLMYFDWIIPVLAINLVCTYFNYSLYGKSHLFACNVGNYFLYILQSIFGIWLTMIISNKIGSSKILEYIGKNTLIFYMFHSKVFFPIFDDILGSFNLSKSLNFIIEIIATTLLLCILSYIINKFLPFLLGKFEIKNNNAQNIKT
ncbi:MAG: acyltransferase family protein [Clostridia bacterium]|nr:acyltransferase family protein [Clostridia bacterium]